jgi:hypothetical protein
MNERDDYPRYLKGGDWPQQTMSEQDDYPRYLKLFLLCDLDT